MINRIIHVAREANDEKLLARLVSYRPLKQIKRERIRSIREQRVDENLWEAYKETVLAANNDT